ncbi:MAG: GNAT family N-acetyltransferase [Blastocatellia bacterium]|nr:GNAT family N-acetyltransferase [Blastocatellia bacterium]
MRSQRIAMTAEEFDLLPMRPGWKYEYYDGKAYIRPGHTIAVVSVEIGPRSLDATFQLQGVTRGDEAWLAETFFDAFRDTVEYCDWERAQIEESSRKSIRTFFEGKRGRPHESSRLAFEEEGKRIAGGALIVTNKGGPLLDILFINPRLQRGGLATALVSDALNELHRQGEKRLRSAYHVGNEASRNWHTKFGFADEPDLSLAQTYLRYAERELWRREKIGDLTEGERAALKAECERLQKRVAELREIADREGFEAVSPLLNLHGL